MERTDSGIIVHLAKNRRDQVEYKLTEVSYHDLPCEMLAGQHSVESCVHDEMHEPVHRSALIPDFFELFVLDLAVFTSVLLKTRATVRIAQISLEVHHILEAVDLAYEERDDETRGDEDRRKYV